MAALALLIWIGSPAFGCASEDEDWTADAPADTPPADAELWPETQDPAQDPVWDPVPDPDADPAPDPVDLPADIPAEETTSGVEPPLGGSSGGSGGAAPLSGQARTADGISYNLIVPAGYSPSLPAPMLIVFSGTEGASVMTSNMLSIAPYAGLSSFIIAVLDGVTYYDNGAAGIPVVDDVRAQYNIDNDRTCLLSESAGTRAGLALGFELRQSYFAAFWANDVNAAGAPGRSAAELGFAPWGNAGPGGDFADAEAIVGAMEAAGYRLPADAPYSGPGSSTHGSTDQFIAACQFFAGKTRQ